MTLECLKGITDTFLKDKNMYSVWIVANVADTVQDEESFIKHSDFSEFFTKAEFHKPLAILEFSTQNWNLYVMSLV